MKDKYVFSSLMRIWDKLNNLLSRLNNWWSKVNLIDIILKIIKKIILKYIKREVLNILYISNKYTYYK